MRDIDDNRSESHREIRQLFPHTGRAHIIGLTGSPGVGKSTLICRMVRHLRKMDKTIGVLAIDPSSPYSGGAILGDRVRIHQDADDESVFIKSIATRGHLGGLSQSAFGIVTVMDAMGKDVILVETVGAGQDEVDIIRLAHTTIVVITAIMGDGIQAVKSGILETADIFALNKADLDGTDSILYDIKQMLSMGHGFKGDWIVPIVKTLAVQDQGVDELLQHTQRHWNYLSVNGLDEYRKQKLLTEFMIHSKEIFSKRFQSALEKNKEYRSWLNKIVNQEIDPYSAAEKLVAEIFNPSNPKSFN